MVKLMEIGDVKNSAVVNVFIDPQNGFADSNPLLNGGSLYVPGGEEILPKMAQLIERSRGGTFILGQDFHPKEHISFMTNHAGIMQYRMDKLKKLLSTHGQPIPQDKHELARMAEQPGFVFHGQWTPFPFDELVLEEKSRNIVGIKESDGRIRKVQIYTKGGHAPNAKDHGRVIHVEPDYLEKTFDEYNQKEKRYTTQTLWTPHCIIGTPSSLYPDALGLPKGLTDALARDTKSATISYTDPATGNSFHVIRKGMNPELDSYGIGLENDRETKTQAPAIFSKVAAELKAAGCEQVILNVSGLATNFCVEFSANNIADFLAEPFKKAGIHVELRQIPELCRGIPIPGGQEAPFSLDGAMYRMADKDVQPITFQTALAQQAPGAEIRGSLDLSGPSQGRSVA